MDSKYDVRINGVLLPPLIEDGLSITPQSLWGANAKRSACTGDFVGDKVSIKYDVALKWGALNASEFAILDGAFNNMLSELNVTMCFDGKTITTKKCYASPPSYMVKKIEANGTIHFSSYSVSLVEI